MAMSVHCDIVSAEKSIFSGRAELVVASGVLGDLGITPGHAALLTELQPGPVRVKKQGGEEEIFYVTGGFIEKKKSKIEHRLSKNKITKPTKSK
jgi:F-type H+-transporting ATPase subunit epsilon